MYINIKYDNESSVRIVNYFSVALNWTYTVARKVIKCDFAALKDGKEIVAIKIKTTTLIVLTRAFSVPYKIFNSDNTARCIL